ncbi:MAG: hypothetical protein HDQ88_04870 [Clostridia bacterium]|nr:hypothetical protein [Clostridia bacterium]
MYVYLINDITGEAIFTSNGVECVYGKEIHFKKQSYTKFLADYLTSIIREYGIRGELQQITYAADIANSIVIAQKNLTVVVSCEAIAEYDAQCAVAYNGSATPSRE